MKKHLVSIGLALFAATAFGKNIDFVITFAPGGISDPAARIVNEQLKEELKNDNINPVLSHKPGAGGQLGAQIVATSTPDNTQILLDGSNMVIAPLVNPLPNAVPLTETLVPIGYIGNFSMVLAVGSHVPVTNVDEFVKFCQNNNINYGSSGIGSGTHLAAASVLSSLKCKSTHIPFTGQGPAIAALAGGHIDAMVTTDGVAKPHQETNRIKILGVAGTEKSPILSDVPLLPKNAKIPTFWIALFVNKNADPKEIDKIKNAVTRTLTNPSIIAALNSRGYVNVGMPIDDAWLKKEQKQFHEIIKQVDINAK
jgi:tripartite-type tricarboxylate transporter receptor subunit TctC